ncbi:MAG: hypothetical protein A4E30_00300 [Methanomassiliicoccales archaeon PtaB.Bin215]|nr:MAG: hypothetical protein A4E30_00300 [Methanomassiliicoccales archaeon PtaB.Bin215]
MRPLMTVRCPQCGTEYTSRGPQYRHHARERLIRHIIDKHEATRDEACDQLEACGIVVHGATIDMCIAQYEEQRERGVVH